MPGTQGTSFSFTNEGSDIHCLPARLRTFVFVFSFFGGTEVMGMCKTCSLGQNCIYKPCMIVNCKFSESPAKNIVYTL